MRALKSATLMKDSMLMAMKAAPWPVGIEGSEKVQLRTWREMAEPVRTAERTSIMNAMQKPL